MDVLANGRVLTDEGFVAGQVVLIDRERIVAVTTANDPRCAQARLHDLGGAMLLPGFVDSQVNGGGGALFNDDPTRINRVVAAYETVTAEQLQSAARKYLVATNRTAIDRVPEKK